MKKIWLAVLVCTLLILLGAPAAWAGPPRSNPVVHIVRWGENLTSIARRYGTTVWAIASANNIGNQNRIYAGQRLIIHRSVAPAPAYGSTPACGATYIVRHGDTLSGIAYRHGVSVNGIVQANGIVNPHRIYAGQRLAMSCAPSVKPAPVMHGDYYIVHRGDTLAKIAMRFGVSLWSIVKANNIANPNVIYTGQRLYIPKGAPYIPKGDPKGGLAKPGCEHLVWPRDGAWLSGIAKAKGTADHVKFGYYKLEYRADGLDDWHYITGAEDPVDSGMLGKWDTRTVADGRYIFRLVVVDETGNYPPPCEIAVRVNNHPW